MMLDWTPGNVTIMALVIIGALTWAFIRIMDVAGEITKDLRK